MDRPLTVFRRHEEQLYLGAAGLVIAVAALLPLLVLCGQLVSSTAPASGPAATLASARIWLLLARSLGVAAAVTALALGVGVPLGFIFARTDAPGRWVAFALHANEHILVAVLFRSSNSLLNFLGRCHPIVTQADYQIAGAQRLRGCWTALRHFRNDDALCRIRQ